MNSTDKMFDEFCDALDSYRNSVIRLYRTSATEAFKQFSDRASYLMAMYHEAQKEADQQRTRAEAVEAELRELREQMET